MSSPKLPFIGVADEFVLWKGVSWAELPAAAWKTSEKSLVSDSKPCLVLKRISWQNLTFDCVPQRETGLHCAFSSENDTNRPH